MIINQYEFLRNGKPFEPTKKELIQFAEYELAKKDKDIKKLKKYLEVVWALTPVRHDGKPLTKLIVIQDFIHDICIKVCDEIRDKLGMNQYNTHKNTAFGVYYDYLKEILDQIENNNIIDL